MARRRISGGSRSHLSKKGPRKDRGRKIRFVRKTRSGKLNMRIFTLREEELRKQAFYLNEYVGLNSINSSRFMEMIIRDVIVENYVLIPEDLKQILIHPQTVWAHRRLKPNHPGYSTQFPEYMGENRHSYELPDYTWNFGMSTELVQYALRNAEFSIWVTLLIILEDGMSHKNLLEITKGMEGGVPTYTLKRFEPNYQYDPDQSSIFNISQTADINQGLVASFRDTFQSNLPNTTVLYDEFDPKNVVCPVMRGPQIFEASIRGQREELGGYCLVWSNLVFHMILDQYAKNQIILTLENAVNFIYERVREFKGYQNVENVSSEDLKEYIRFYSGKYSYEIFKSDILQTPHTIYPTRLHLLWKFIQKTIPYKEVVEKMLRGFIKTDKEPPQIILRRTPITQSPAFSRLEVGQTLESVLSGYVTLYGRPRSDPDHIYQAEFDGSILQSISKTRVGLLRLWNFSTAEKIDADHVNVLILEPTIERGRLKRLTIHRFEPSYRTEFAPQSMANLSEESVWNEILILALKSYIPTTLVSQDRTPSEAEIIYKPVISGICPNFGPQASEIAVIRGQGEHVGYCQTWSLKFIETFLNMKFNSIGIRVRGIPRYSQQVAEGTIIGQAVGNQVRVMWDGQTLEYLYNVSELTILTDMNNITGAVIDHMFREAGGTDSNSLYDYIKGVASRYANIILDEFYLPLFTQTPTNP